MSLHFLGFDVLDGIPIAHYLSDEDEDSHDERSGERSSHNNSVISLGAGSVATSILSTRPPVWVQVVAPNSVQEDEEEEEDDSEEGSRGGITILSSVPSSQASLVYRGGPAAEISVISTSPRLPGNAANAAAAVHSHALSISTTESLYEDQHSLSSQVLSLGPSSLASSLVDVSLGLSSSTGSPGSSSGQEGHYYYHHESASPIVLRRVADHLLTVPNTGTDEEITQNQQSPNNIWYAHFKTEQDWEQFTDQTLQVLAALEEYDDDQQQQLVERREKMDPEKHLALLIQQEENLFWQDPSDRRRRYCYAWIFLGEMALALATATVASFGAASLARR